MTLLQKLGVCIGGVVAGLGAAGLVDIIYNFFCNKTTLKPEEYKQEVKEPLFSRVRVEAEKDGENILQEESQYHWVQKVSSLEENQIDDDYLPFKRK